MKKVRKPSRYIDSEWNAYKKNWDEAAVKICLAFPDLYELGSSGLGIEILYHIINSRDDALAERVFSPDYDMESLLRDSGVPICSLEGGKPLREFDMVGFSLEYELTYTNVLNVLDLAGIPLESSLRDESYPLVAGGGPCCSNPEPVSDFFDFFVLGDGEEVICEIIDALRNGKNGKLSKKQMLENLAGIEGVYVPSFYKVSYKSDGKTGSIETFVKSVPETVSRRVVDLNKVHFPSKQIVSFVQRVHDRLNIEIARGCPNSCRFCQARSFYHPYRYRDGRSIINLVESGLKATGFDEVVLSSLSSSSYRGIEKLVGDISSMVKKKRISISLPSLRCDSSSLAVMNKLKEVRRSGLTFAVEAGTENLRKRIGKYITDDNIESILLQAHKMGWKLVKLYFMIGLPGEADDDVKAIAGLIKRLKKSIPKLNLNISVSPFVPKSQTPFQWAGQGDMESWRRKKSMLQKMLPAKVKFHDLRTSFLEGVFSRGDRRLGRVLRRAWELGARFDQWGDRLKFEIWEQVFRELSVNVSSYLRDRDYGEILPWDHLTVNPSKKKLMKEAEEQPAVVSDESRVSGVLKDISESGNEKPAGDDRTVQRYRLRFGRKGSLKMLSHLEQIEMFRRLFRRAGVPVNYSRGFNPQPLISFGPAISVGYESESEYVDAELTERIDKERLVESLAGEMPENLSLISCRTVPVIFPSIESSANVMDYSISGDFPENMNSLLKEFESALSVVITRNKKDKQVQTDIKPLVREIRFSGTDLYASLRFMPGKKCKPTDLLEAMLPGKSCENFDVCRKDIFLLKKSGELREV